MLKIKYTVYMIIFIIISICIFFIQSFEFLIGIMLLGIAILLLNKFIREFIKILKVMFPVMVILVIINLIFDGFKLAMLVGIRVFDCFILTFIFSKINTLSSLSKSITNLFVPFKIFGVDVYKIEIIISIALCLIPCLKNEILGLKNSLKIKGARMNLKNSMLILKIQFILMLRKIDSIEKSMIAKGFEE